MAAGRNLSQAVVTLGVRDSGLRRNRCAGENLPIDESHFDAGKRFPEAIRDDALNRPGLAGLLLARYRCRDADQ